MAKGNMLLGQARGKVGDVVFSRSNGQQVIRARSAQVKNTKTTAQTLQRIVMNTVSQAYSFMLPICDHSFEGIKTGQNTMSAFMKRNLNLLRRKITIAREQTGSLTGIYSFTPVGSKQFALNNFIMSEGTLPRIAVTGLVTQAVANQGAQLTIEGAGESMTYADFISAYGLQKGDQVTFVQITKTADGSYLFNYARVILDPMDEEGVPAPITSQMIVENAFNVPNSRNEGIFQTLKVENGVLTFHLGGGTPVAACVIVSRQDSTGLWLRSTSTLTIPANLIEFDQVSLLDAIDLYYSGGIDLGSDWYLNNSTASATSGQSSTSAKPQLLSGSIAGYTLLGSATLNVAPSSASPLTAEISFFDSSQNIKIVGTTRNLSVGDMYDSQAGDIVVACNNSSVNTTVDLSAEGSYKFFFVYGGYVRKSLNTVVVATPATPSVTAATFNGTSLLSNQTIQSITAGTQGTLAVTTSDTGSMSAPKIAIVKSNTQPSVGGTVSSPLFNEAVVNNSVSKSFTFASSGNHYLLLADGSSIVAVVSAINVKAAGGDDATPGEGD